MRKKDLTRNLKKIGKIGVLILEILFEETDRKKKYNRPKTSNTPTSIRKSYIKEGEQKCGRCNGKGVFYYKNGEQDSCKICKGKGKVAILH